MTKKRDLKLGDIVTIPDGLKKGGRLPAMFLEYNRQRQCKVLCLSDWCFPQWVFTFPEKKLERFTGDYSKKLQKQIRIAWKMEEMKQQKIMKLIEHKKHGIL